MPEYTGAAATAVVAVVALELTVLRTGLFRHGRYWASIGIVFAFQVLVNGWLSRLEAPTFLYHPDAITGVRFPWDIPVEDIAYGWSLVTVSIALWIHAGARHRARVGS